MYKPLSASPGIIHSDETNQFEQSTIRDHDSVLQLINAAVLQRTSHLLHHQELSIQLRPNNLKNPPYETTILLYNSVEWYLQTYDVQFPPICQFT